MINKNALRKLIEVHPDVQHGRPCVRGTRIPVYVILESLATGMTIETICKEFAPITCEDIQACIMFGALLANEQEVITEPA